MLSDESHKGSTILTSPRQNRLFKSHWVTLVCLPGKIQDRGKKRRPARYSAAKFSKSFIATSLSKQKLSELPARSRVSWRDSRRFVESREGAWLIAIQFTSFTKFQP
jgi:hypothetical protein